MESQPPTELVQGCVEDHAHPRLISKRKRPLFVRAVYRVEDLLEELDWVHFAFKFCAYIYLFLILWIAWQLLPVYGHWHRGVQSDKVPILYQDFSNYFVPFEGFANCGIRLKDLYTLPPRDEKGFFGFDAFCPGRQPLLEAMSDGGRVGFDAPYTPKGCHYRWYSVEEICMILSRFDGLVFIGDSSLQTVYNGFNILLRQDLALGAVRAWEMDDATRESCRCNAQFTTPSCADRWVKSSDDVNSNTPSIGTPYLCKRTPHAMLSITGSTAPADVIARFRKLVPKTPRSRYQPIPIIHSLSPSTAPIEAASGSLLEFLKLADDSTRKTQMLWVGPTAAGHIVTKDRKGNQEIWDFDSAMAKTAHDNGIEVLKMWNMTVQASSSDGLRFGEKVAITQAMMVINWLSRLESS